ncbi:MAG: signal peptidase I [Pseudomonadota bacterium]
MKTKIGKFNYLFIALLFLLIVYLLICLIRWLGYGFSYQASMSMPKGLYFVMPAKQLKRDDIVIFHPPRVAQEFLAKHPWGPPNNVLMKVVMGVPGDKVCKREHGVWINGQYIAPVFSEYAPGKALLNLAFCEILPAKHYLLMSTHVRRSFDGRYFGPVTKAEIIGKAIKV